MRALTMIKFVLLLAGVITMNPITTAAPSSLRKSKSARVTLNTFGSKEMEKKLEGVGYDWTKLSTEDQKIFKESLSHLDNKLKQANKVFKLSIKIFRKGGLKLQWFNKKVFSNKFIRDARKVAKKPETLTPKKAEKYQSEILEIIYNRYRLLFKEIGTEFPKFNPDSDIDFNFNFNTNITKESTIV